MLSGWQNFNILVGTAAATLTGLMFIATTLMAGIDAQVTTLNAGLANYHTPTITHFFCVLLMAAILSAPWPDTAGPGVLLGLLGAGMALYAGFITRRIGRITHFAVPLHDRLWYGVFPLLAYGVVLVGALLLAAYPDAALYAIAAAMLALLFIGLRNAWDLVSFLAIERAHDERKSSSTDEADKTDGA